jgi:serine/threonine protein kinase
MIVDTVFKTIEKLHAIGINHGDAHLDNLMVTYEKPYPGTEAELKDYLAHRYVYKFIDFGAAEAFNEMNLREKYKQMIGDYSKAADSVGALAEDDSSLHVIKEYAEEKTRKLAIQYGLISEEVDDDEEWSDED